MHKIKRDHIIEELLKIGVKGDNAAIARAVGQAMQDAKRLHVHSISTDPFPPGGTPGAITITLRIELPPETNETWEQTARKIRDAGGDAWDRVADPDKLIREMRGEET